MYRWPPTRLQVGIGAQKQDNQIVASPMTWRRSDHLARLDTEFDLVGYVPLGNDLINVVLPRFHYSITQQNSYFEN